MRPAGLAATVIIALALTVASTAYQRVGPTRLVEGEGFCPGREPCFVPVLGAGFPLAFLVDNPQISVPRSVHLVEDDFRPGAFVLDAIFYLGLTAAAARVVRHRSRHRSRGG